MTRIFSLKTRYKQSKERETSSFQANKLREHENEDENKVPDLSRTNSYSFSFSFSGLKLSNVEYEANFPF